MTPRDGGGTLSRRQHMTARPLTVASRLGAASRFPQTELKYEGQSRRYQDAEAHDCNSDWIISGHPKHFERLLLSADSCAITPTSKERRLSRNSMESPAASPIQARAAVSRPT